MKHHLSILLASIILLTCTLFISAEAASPPLNETPYQILNGFTNPPPCAERDDGGSVGYGDIVETDGFRWRFETRVENSRPLTNLVIDFVCESDRNGGLYVLLTHSEPWACSALGNGVTVNNDSLFFDGTGGLSCQGNSVKQTVETVLPHLSLNLPTSFVVSNIYANGVVLPEVAATCSPSQPLFTNTNVSYAVPFDGAMASQLRLAHLPGTASALVALSSPISLSQITSISTQLENSKAGYGFAHAANNQTFDFTPIPTSHQFVLSSTLQTVLIGADEQGFFCGQIDSLEVDPYTPIVSG